ncbi:MAG TPA: heavy metal translocating P-type ATPase, partial [Synergistaceae bacterium]|nr:heavy metal translocating P-type ATPase [Synergistaceae bacterium]
MLLLGAYLGAAWDVLREAGRRLWQGRGLDEMALMAGASLGALALGDLEEALGVMVFYKIGELLQERAEGRSRRSIRALLALRPDRARVRR